MMLYPLKTGFQLQRLTKNCLEAGFDENQYAKIDSDMKEVAAFLKKSWDSLERMPAVPLPTMNRITGPRARTS